MKKGVIILSVLLVSAGLGRAQTAKTSEHRWESNLSAGYIDYESLSDPPGGYVDNMNRHIAIVKSFWFYPFLPRVLSFGLSFDYVTDDLPLSADVALNLPLKRIVPFVSAGAGFSFSGNTLQNYGGGLKFRTGKHFGLIAEFRRYRVRKKSQTVMADEAATYVTRKSYYFGAGIAYLY